MSWARRLPEPWEHRALPAHGEGPATDWARELGRIRRALEALEGDLAGLDIKPLRGQSPWLRLRVGDYRVLYRRLDSDEDADASLLVARVVHRSELERAVATLA